MYDITSDSACSETNSHHIVHLLTSRQLQWTTHYRLFSKYVAPSRNYIY